VLEIPLIGTENDGDEQAKNNIRFAFKLCVLVTWVLLLLPLYPLLTYASVNANIWQRYSTPYLIGLVLYISISLLWLALLGLPVWRVKRISSSLEVLNSDSKLRLQFVLTCVLVTLLVLTAIRRWGWGNNWILRLNIVLLCVWTSSMPIFWEWTLHGWSIKRPSISRLYDWFVQNPRLWLPLLIGIGALGASNVLGFSASQRQLMLVLGLLMGVGIVLIFLRYPPLGLILTLIGGLFIPFSGPSGLNVAALGVALLLGLWLLDMLVRQRKIRLLSSRAVAPLLIFILISILSFSVGQLPWFTYVKPAPLDTQLGGLAIFVFAAGAFLLVAHQLRNLDWLRWMTWVFLALGSIYIAGWLVPGVGPIANRLFQNGTVNNAMFWVWLVALAFSQAIINRKLHIFWRLGLGGLVVATLYVAFFLNRGWKSGYLPAFVVLAAIVAFRYPRARLFLLLLGYIPAHYLVSQAIATEQFSFGTRVDAWAIMLKISKINPLLGLGPANYYWYVPLYYIRGYYSVFSSHNQYLDLIAQTGLLGLGCVLWFAWEVGRLGWQLRTRVPAGFSQAYVYGALGGLVGTLAAGVLADWFLPFAYNIGLTGFRASILPWLFLGGLVSIEQIVRQ
jgi:hypothetical protein